jgi:hypothetical protein
MRAPYGACPLKDAADAQGQGWDVVIMKAKRENASESWDAVARRLERRSAHQWRCRWVNYLSPRISSEPWTPEEDQLLVERINEKGMDWVAIKHSFK